MNLHIGSLCSGYGGLELGLQQVVGGTVAWHAEYDAAPSRVLAERFPGVPNLGDITTCDWSQVWEDTVMGAPRNDERANAMYSAYQTGLSLAQVAEQFGCTRQSAYVIFRRRGWNLHARPPGRLFEVYDGVRYSLRNNGYYAATSGDREYLHRQMWIDANGPIPDGYEIHHLDHDKSHNSLENFECLTKEDHARLYGTGCNQHTHGCTPDCDEEVVPTDSPAVDWLTAGYP